MRGGVVLGSVWRSWWFWAAKQIKLSEDAAVVLEKCVIEWCCNIKCMLHAFTHAYSIDFVIILECLFYV